MKKHQRMVRKVMSARGHKLFVCALVTATMQMSIPVVAENLTGGGKLTDLQAVEQERIVTGTVVDEHGEPLIGVSVMKLERSCNRS